ncbi:inclusion membrane protein A [Legionella beliardensis]|uniref:Inclusion membrane protein A n=1 Tax=Legionella beliardensis TaxID=91822 RepID=A0A378I0K4_9GAMM|nr:LegC2/C7 family Dot/Icm T4SS effector [Legionella beliardensis]STX28116.1 inclusion membrane protein A [Legionella beliardensis]
MSSNAKDLIGEEQLSDAVIIESYKFEQDNLKKIALTQEHLLQIKNNLGAIIDLLSKDKSIFTKASDYWGDLPIWQKIIGGVVLSFPTLAAGVAAHLGVLLALSGATVVVYATGSIILDDHHSYNKNITEHLKKGIFYLADILSITISALDKIREDLSVEIQKFKTENQKLANNVAVLSEKIESLTNQIELFVATERLLKETQEKLEKEAERLKQSASENEVLLEKNAIELTQVRKDYEQSRRQLNEKVTELVEVKTTLEAEVKKAKNVATALQSTVKTLSGTVIKDGKNREIFQKRITEVIDSGEQSFLVINDRVQSLEKELREVKEQLEQSNNRYHELLDRQETQVERLEKMGMTELKLKQAREELETLRQQRAAFLAENQRISVLSESSINPASNAINKTEDGIHVHGLYAKSKSKSTTQPVLESKPLY